MIRSKNIKALFHLIVWLGMTFILNSELIDLEWGPMSRQNNTLLVPLVFGMFINAILFYSNANWLLPGYLHKRRKKEYWKWVTALVIGLTFIEVFFDTLYLINTYLKDVLVALTPIQRRDAILEIIAMFGVLDLFINIVFWGMAFLYRLPKDWIKNERQKQQLKQDKLTAELDFLKAQINPHFLFNGINSIYHLMEEDVRSAQKILLQFSELLRYQLYECKEDFIPLRKELQYVSNYLEIETIRKGEDAIIKIELPEINKLNKDNDPKIAPLLFSPFLENAFKYLSLYSEKEKNILETSLTIRDHAIHFSVKNTINLMAQKGRQKSSSCIGLENIKRRLNILYPGKHRLSLEEVNGCFLVELEISLI